MSRMDKKTLAKLREEVLNKFAVYIKAEQAFADEQVDSGRIDQYYFDKLKTAAYAWKDAEAEWQMALVEFAYQNKEDE